MDIFSLFLLYYLSQKPEILESLKPLATAMKSSEQTLQFLNDLKAFISVFDGAGLSSTKNCTANATNSSAENSTMDGRKNQPKRDAEKEGTEHSTDKQNRQSPFQGIADELLQQYLDEYLKNG